MTRAQKEVQKADLFNIPEIAKRCGMGEREFRAGGAAFFAKLAESKTKLMGPIVAASTASGANPKKFLSLIDVFAFELDDGSLPESTAKMLKQRLKDVSTDAVGKAHDTAEKMSNNSPVLELSGKIEHAGCNIVKFAKSENVQGVIGKISNLAESKKKKGFDKF